MSTSYTATGTVESGIVPLRQIPASSGAAVGLEYVGGGTALVMLVTVGAVPAYSDDGVWIGELGPASAVTGVVVDAEPQPARNARTIPHSAAMAR